ERGGALPLELQARILAAQPRDEITRRTGVSRDVIDAYQATVFHVEDRLTARDWVLLEAIHQGHPTVGVDAGAAVILKRCAFFAGPVVLDAVIPYLIGGRDLWADPPDLSTPEGRLDQKTRLFVALEMLPQDAKTGWKLMKIFMERLLRTEKAHSPGFTAQF